MSEECRHGRHPAECPMDNCETNWMHGEIDRKNTVIARLQALTDSVAKTLDCAPDEIATEATSVYRAWCDDREKIGKLREALEPFAQNYRRDDDKDAAWAHATCHIDDFRRAARVMEETK